jgi:hypothetical protein
MRDATGIHIQRIIVHVVDHHRHGEPILSEVELPLASDSKLRPYFETQVAYILEGPAIAARFSSEGDKSVGTLCNDIINNPRQFVACSQKLGERLFETMKGDKRISPGSLAICLYNADNYSGTHFLALVKIDPTEVLMQKIMKDERGRRYVGFDVRGDVLPTAREQLHKAALVRPRADGAEYDLLLLDRQITGAVKAVADFFAKTFLNTVPAFDARERTKRMYSALIAAQNKIRPMLKPQAAETLRERIAEAVQAEKVDLDQWVDTLAVPEKAQALIRDELTKALPDKQFALDTTFAGKLIQKRKFSGDYELRLSVRAENFGDVIMSVEPPEENGRQRWRIVIETERWEEIL